MPITVADLERTVNSGLTTTIKKSEINFDQLFLDTDVENLISVILFLKTNGKCKFKQLIDITAVDYPKKEKRFKIVYFLLSHEKNFRTTIYINVNEKDLIPSITKI
jgi:NADH-quinone oxidoreductase subunit C